MLIFNTTWKNTIFYKLIITFILILTPVFVFGAKFYEWGKNTVEMELIRSMESQTQFFINNLDNEIMRIKNLQYSFLEDDDLNKLANASNLMSEIEKVAAIRRLQQKLQILNNSSKYIQDTSVHIPSINRTISAIGGTRKIIDDLSEVEYKNIATLSSSTGFQLHYKNTRIFVNVNSPSAYHADKLPVFIIEIELSLNRLRNSLVTLAWDNEGGEFLFNTSDGNIIVGTSNTVLASKILDFINKRDIEQRIEVQQIIIDSKGYFVFNTVSKDLNVSLVNYVPEAYIYKPLEKYEIIFWIFTFVVVVIIFLYSFSTYKFIHKPLIKLANSFKELEGGKLDVKIEHSHNDEFRYIYHKFNIMADKLNTLINQTYIQKIHMQKAELKQLQSQINPHFLYNSYFILHRIIKKMDYENAVLFSKQMGSYFQYITRTSADEVPLVNEVGHARIYADIQAMRFEGRISVDFGSLPSEYQNVLVPKLILQPIIENAFNYGLENKLENGLLFVKFEKCDNGLLINVEDNGEQISDADILNLSRKINTMETEEECTGIKNINKRIRLMMGDKSGLSLSRSEIGGLKVSIMIVCEGEIKCD